MKITKKSFLIILCTIAIIFLLQSLVRSSPLENRTFCKPLKDREQSPEYLNCTSDTFFYSTNEFVKIIMPESVKLNKEGYAYYQKQDWANAEQKFRAAAELDGRNVFAFYNYACTLSLHYGRECPESILREIETALERAADQSCRYCEKIQTDPDLAAVRTRFNTFRRAKHYPIELDNEYEFKLSADGKLEFRIMVSGGDAGMGPAEEQLQKDMPAPEWESFFGSYCVIGKTIFFFYEKPAAYGFPEATLSMDCEWFDKMENEYRGY